MIRLLLSENLNRKSYGRNKISRDWRQSSGLDDIGVNKSDITLIDGLAERLLPQLIAVSGRAKQYRKINLMQTPLIDCTTATLHPRSAILWTFHSQWAIWWSHRSQARGRYGLSDSMLRSHGKYFFYKHLAACHYCFYQIEVEDIILSF